VIAAPQACADLQRRRHALRGKKVAVGVGVTSELDLPAHLGDANSESSRPLSGAGLAREANLCTVRFGQREGAEHGRSLSGARLRVQILRRSGFQAVVVNPGFLSRRQQLVPVLGDGGRTGEVRLDHLDEPRFVRCDAVPVEEPLEIGE
jgi:hypothetical protein